MKRVLLIGGLIALGVGTAYLVRRRMMMGGGVMGLLGNDWADRWHVVTVNRPPDSVSQDGQLPDPLSQLGNLIVVEIKPAAGRRGTEIAGRLSDPTANDAKKAVRRLRRALRETKSLLETGEVLVPDRPSTNRPSFLGLPIDILTRRSREEGRL